MDRRAFALGMAALPLAARSVRAQSTLRVHRIGFLATNTPLAELVKGTGPEWTSHGAMVEGLRRLGWTPGHNVEFHWRSGESRYERLPRLAEELVRMPVDLIVAFGEGAQAAHRATKTLPIVMAAADPVASGLAVSLSRPGRNVTGVTQVTATSLAKSLAVLKEAAPRVSRVALITHSLADEYVDRAPVPRPTGEIGKAAGALGIEAFFLVCRDPGSMAQAMQGAVFQGADAAWVEGHYAFYKHAEMPRIIAREAVKLRIPVMQQELRAVAEGGLLAHGPDFAVGYRRLPYYVDRILRGEKPGDIPIEQPSRIELHVNLAAARAIGLRFPPTVLIAADKVYD